jgi:ABC-type glycerol-3-phosphate transport system substrate-binding protein
MEEISMKRKMVFVFTVALVLAMLAGALPGSAQDGGVEILIWMTGGENDAVIAQKAADVWAEATGNTVKIEPVDWGTAHARILTAATSGEGPDIITGALSWGIEFGELGGMLDLNAAHPEDIAAMQAADNPEQRILALVAIGLPVEPIGLPGLLQCLLGQPLPVVQIRQPQQGLVT